MANRTDTSSPPAKPRRKNPRPTAPLLNADLLPEPAQLLDGVKEQVWIEVIQKMDEVYHDLLQYEVALEEKNAELEASQQFIEEVLASMSDILIVCDRHGLIEDVNASLIGFTGLSEETLKRRPVIDLFTDPASRHQAHDFFANAGATEIQDCEMDLIAADGTAVPVSMNCMPRRTRTGKFVGVVMTGRPVGDLRKAYKALRRAHDDLKRTQQQLLHSEKMASLGRLVAGVAHELNNPISFVLGNVFALQRYAQRLQTYVNAFHAGDSPKAMTEQRAALKIDRALTDLQPLIDGMIEGAERTRDIVDGLKRFSAIDRQADEIFDLVEVIERAIRWVSTAAPGRLAVTRDLPPTMHVRGSPGQMQQVMMNLVQNAADATAQQADAALLISARKGATSWEISFHDSGTGIPEESLGHLFEPFFTTKPVGQGTGLGLSISYGIVERHGGRLTASNHPSGGAVFTVTLPAERAPSDRHTSG
jgi:two-component system sensor histidine kinase HupT/HoxJ